MQSVKSKILLWIIRNRHLLQFKLRPEVINENFSVNKFREDVKKATARLKMPKDVTVEKTKIYDMYSEWIIPEHYPQDKVLLYIHGGGFISGSCDSHRTHVAKFAKGSNLKSILFDYRLAPEHPFPAAVNDCIVAYEWLLNQKYKPENIVVGGESAGGTLTLSLLLALKDKGLPYPKAAFSISPVTDVRYKAESVTYNATKDITPTGNWDHWIKHYNVDNDPTNPLLSPLFGNFQGLPPLYICVGTHEIHLDDCVNVAEKAKEAGVKVTLAKWENMVHAFPIMAPLFPEATKALKEICDFVKQQLGEL